jgi:hypothetical protein
MLKKSLLPSLKINVKDSTQVEVKYLDLFSISYEYLKTNLNIFSNSD